LNPEICIRKFIFVQIMSPGAAHSHIGTSESAPVAIRTGSMPANRHRFRSGRRRRDEIHPHGCARE
jgi:hypothetical protein